MKNLAALFALIAAAGVAAAQETNNLSFRFPVRVVNGERIDLRPLFTHWGNKALSPTNSRWVLLTGTIAADRPDGWIVDGKTESVTGVELRQKVLLLSPPRKEKEALEMLLAEQKELKDENSTLAGDVKSAGKHPPQPKYHHVHYIYNPRAVALEKTNLLNDESGVEGQLKQVDKELAAIPTTTAHEQTVYRVDFFVFWTGRVQNGLPAMDFGMPTR